MQHSSSRPAPRVFRGFGLCVGAVLAGYLGLIGFLGIGIKDALDRGTTESRAIAQQARPHQAEITGSIPAIPVIKTNASD